ncbi:cell division protein FtsA [Salisediminibacterium halotolerans]|uniref:cell division protein FtsA n=1 Tax=Salisediminibacterium halotolerans TaxID=517425 RepID=UPI000EB1F75C|nr:cell division protein FtsA [Salisediminibacterium halotolerans]RLJ69390.1 cell division protein FtsA [Actinophytocola xinjiangensis]RPE83984.1 cell division protein FtsA [Salisediminibacterium halotolerans]TWG32465.1 cell division protein FtsA [Salisediminibacterium halotolerans]GEL08058.1 cell division protein FtsA [Salisediminibacterium halotolerans]
MHEPSSSYLFALDIGTRSVVGLILAETNDGYHVLDIVTEEHPERSMLDGQIHNIPEVSAAIVRVKTKLESIYGPLYDVSVAAAGRSLKTVRAKETVSLEGNHFLDRSSLLHLELSAVQKAQFQLANQYRSLKDHPDYCVGYSILTYELDGEHIGSLLEQQGTSAGVEVIATFLPKVVVESLLAALNRAGLRLKALTLEPIAAINVLIPASMRRLNIALVDIGAGTSDIAITDSGTVSAYGMVPNAGDEITEAVSDQFLLDFPESESVKRRLSEETRVNAVDILGIEHTLTGSDVIEALSPAVDHLTELIREEILTLNKKAPRAVMLVGGGSMTPKLAEKLAEKLQIPAERIAVRGVDAIKNLTFAKEQDKSPEFVTPIGIAIAAKETPVEYLSVTVNDSPVRMFNVKELTAGDALLTGGFDLAELYGKPGAGITVTVNGRPTSVPGTLGTPPDVVINGKPAAIDSLLNEGDEIKIQPGQSGKDAEAAVSDLLEGELAHKLIYINDQPVTVFPAVNVNNHPAAPTRCLQDRDSLTIQTPATVQDVLALAGHSVPSEKEPVKVTLNGKSKIIDTPGADIFINDHAAPVMLNQRVQNGDRLTLKNEAGKDRPTVYDILSLDYREVKETITVTFNDEPVTLTKDRFTCYLNGERVAMDKPVFHGNRIEIEENEHEPFIFQDVFAAVNIFRPDDPQLKPLISLNGQHTAFSTPINKGDQLELIWQ